MINKGKGEFEKVFEKIFASKHREQTQGLFLGFEYSS